MVEPGLTLNVGGPCHFFQDYLNNT